MGWRHKAEYYGYRAASLAARRLPARVGEAGARGLSVAVAAAMPGRRRIVARHLQRVYGGQLSGRALARAVRATFVSYGEYWLESFRLPSLSGADIEARFSVDGYQHVEAALGAGNGVIVALPHLGSWEICGPWLSRRGVPTTVVVEPLQPPELFAWFVGLRRLQGITVVPLGAGAGTSLLRALRRNELIGLFCDRDIGGGGVEVELFGERTTLPAGPATLGLRTGAPILPTAVYQRGGGRQHAVVRPPLVPERTGRLRDDVSRLTQHLAWELEQLIRRAPEQWHLLQPNWPSDREGGR